MLETLLAQATTTVGLQLLTSPALADATSAVAGVALPIYHTAALASETKSSSNKNAAAAARRRRWMRYWCVLGAAALAERVVFGGSAKISSSTASRRSSSASSPSSLPGYSHARLLFLLWLTSSKYQGARRLFDAVIAPAAAAAAPAVAEARDDARSLFDRHPGFAAAADAAHRALSSLPVLKWVLEVPPKEEGEDESAREEESFAEVTAASKTKKKSRWWSLLG